LFNLKSDYKPAGDQPQAIEQLVSKLKKNEQSQVLLGVTGSGKTFTMAHTINKMQCPTLIMAPNKTLAAQLYSEMKEFFPDNAVEYFVSYYDYYQPEAYVPRRDLFIEKEASINEQLDRMRHAATRALFERPDTIIVASVSCIYGIGSAEIYSSMAIPLKKNGQKDRQQLLNQLVELQYTRNDIDFQRGNFRVRGDLIEIFPSHSDSFAWRLDMFDDDIEGIYEIDPLTGKKAAELEEITIYPNSHYVTPRPSLNEAIKKIKIDLQNRIHEFESEKKLLEAQRIRERVSFDLEMMESTGSCAGIENYSRYLTGRKEGEPPPTLFEYLPKNSLLFVDESHIAVPQLHGMYKGDYARKTNLSDFGFRLPACKDNRPLKFQEWDNLRPRTIFVSATPNNWELEQTQGEFAEQIVRPTGLLDPVCLVRPTENQIDDLIAECVECSKKNERVLVTTLTKKMAEALTEYMNEAGLKVRYVHSDIDTIERIDIIRNLRLGNFEVLIGINLLREGLDIPECALIAILDADKEGYLRSKTSLIQTIGRAARNISGRAILYADTMTKSMSEAIEETQRRREKQQKYNVAKGITPESIKKNINNILESVFEKDHVTVEVQKARNLSKQELKREIKELAKEMHIAAGNLEFEKAAKLRDRIKSLEKDEILKA
jgi:excinuclease ABC subunit B